MGRRGNGPAGERAGGGTGRRGLSPARPATGPDAVVRVGDPQAAHPEPRPDTTAVTTARPRDGPSPRATDLASRPYSLPPKDQGANCPSARPCTVSAFPVTEQSSGLPPVIHRFGETSQLDSGAPPPVRIRP